MSLHRANAWLLCLAAVSGGCADVERKQAHVAVGTDAGTDAGDAAPAFDVEQFVEAREAAYCDAKLDVVCSVDDPTASHCDLDTWLAKQCAADPETEVTKNGCGGVTFLGFRAFGGHARWHYDENGELIGADLLSDTTQYCGKHQLELGTNCALTSKTLRICRDRGD